jgi:RimJ/RimL family protein N-acetyltransferase
MDMLSNKASRQQFSIQKLGEEYLAIFQAIRLESLLKEPHLFGSTFDRESRMSNQEWLDRLTNPNSAYFALKVGEECVGLTGIVTDRDNPQRALLIASYIREEYRRNGGSGLLYHARLDWARKNGFAEVIVSHRASNEPSKKANQKHGFEYTHSTPHEWNDGVVEDEKFYRLKL